MRDLVAQVLADGLLGYTTFFANAQRRVVCNHAVQDDGTSIVQLTMRSFAAALQLLVMPVLYLAALVPSVNLHLEAHSADLLFHGQLAPNGLARVRILQVIHILSFAREAFLRAVRTEKLEVTRNAILVLSCQVVMA